MPLHSHHSPANVSHTADFSAHYAESAPFGRAQYAHAMHAAVARPKNYRKASSGVSIAVLPRPHVGNDNTQVAHVAFSLAVPPVYGGIRVN